MHAHLRTVEDEISEDLFEGKSHFGRIEEDNRLNPEFLMFSNMFRGGAVLLGPGRNHGRNTLVGGRIEFGVHAMGVSINFHKRGLCLMRRARQIEVDWLVKLTM